jgi:hypothetical protein
VRTRHARERFERSSEMVRAVVSSDENGEFHEITPPAAPNAGERAVR